MLSHPTLDKLQSLKLNGMYQALIEQMNMADIGELSFEERGWPSDTTWACWSTAN